MRKLLTCIVLCIGFFIIGNIGNYAEASNKEYEIENTEFKVFLNKDGSAQVKERWDINFKKGDFTNFKVSRLLNPNELENYYIKFDDFKINDITCAETNDIDGRPEGTYSITKDDNLIEYAWYFKACNEKLTFENNYKLTNLVKYTDSGNALFCYRFVGKEFEKDIKNLDICINMPDKGNIDVRYDSDMKYEIYDDNRIELNKSNSSGMVKINLAMDKNMFSNNIGYISQETIDKIYQSEKDSEEFVDFFFKGIAAISITLIIWTMYVYLKKKRLAKDDNYIRRVMDKLKNDGVTPYEFSRLCGVNRVYFNEFKLIFLDLLRRDVFRIEEDKFYINYNMRDGLKYFEVQVVDFLYWYKDLNNGSYMTMEDLLNIMKDNEKIVDLMYNCTSTMIKSYKKENKKAIEVLKMYFKNYALGYTRDMEEIIKKYTNENYIELNNLYYMASVVDTTSEKDGSAYEDNLWHYMNFSSMYYVDNSSSSSSSESGCASCSSCSSCGGGGAD